MPSILAQTTVEPMVWWAGVIVCALVVVWVVLRRGSRRRDPLVRGGEQMGLARQRNLERDITQLMTELSEMARQINGQLDGRMTELRQVLAQADEKIAALKMLAVAPHPAMNGEGKLKPTIPAPAPPDAQHVEIYALADEGRGIAEIARRLGRPSGEVELILALRPRGSPQ